MPSQTKAQATLFRLAKYYKKHHTMPEGTGPASPAVRQIAQKTDMQTIDEFTHMKKKHKQLVEK